MSIKDEIIKRITDLLQSKYRFSPSSIRLSPMISVHNEILAPDIVVYGRKDSKEIPTLVVETTPNMNPLSSEKLLYYLEKLNARYGIVTDGNNHIYYDQISPHQFVEVPDIVQELQTQIVAVRKQFLNSSGSLIDKFEKIAWMIYDDFPSKDDPGFIIEVIRSFQSILLCKIADEQFNNSNPLFNVDPIPTTAKEQFKAEEEIQKKVLILFDKVKVRYPDIFEPQEEIYLNSDLIFKIALELQSYSISGTDRKIVRTAYDYVIQMFIDKLNMSKKHRYFYTTPKSVTDFIVKLLQPSVNETVFDPDCGVANFLVSCLAYIENWANNQLQINNKDELVSKYAKQKLYGTGTGTMSSFAKINMLINGADHNHIFTFSKDHQFPESETTPYSALVLFTLSSFPF